MPVYETGNNESQRAWMGSGKRAERDGTAITVRLQEDMGGEESSRVEGWSAERLIILALPPPLVVPCG